MQERAGWHGLIFKHGDVVGVSVEKHPTMQMSSREIVLKEACLSELQRVTKVKRAASDGWEMRFVGIRAKFMVRENDFNTPHSELAHCNCPSPAEGKDDWF